MYQQIQIVMLREGMLGGGGMTGQLDLHGSEFSVFDLLKERKGALSVGIRAAV